MTTFAPAAAKISAIPNPIPLLAPVMRATFPSSEKTEDKSISFWVILLRKDRKNKPTDSPIYPQILPK
jgi:hypothetical protein